MMAEHDVVETGPDINTVLVLLSLNDIIVSLAVMHDTLTNSVANYHSH